MSHERGLMDLCFTKLGEDTECFRLEIRGQRRHTRRNIIRDRQRYDDDDDDDLTYADLKDRFLYVLRRHPHRYRQIFLEGIQKECGGVSGILKEYLPACSRLEEITLYSCYLGKAGTEALLPLLANQPNLKTLTLWACNFGDSSRSAKKGGDKRAANKIQLMEALAQNKAWLTKLAITQDKLEGHEMAQSIQRLLAHNKLLQYIHLGSCDQTVLEAIATAVEDNVFYQQIHVYGNADISSPDFSLMHCQKRIDLFLALNKAGRRYLVPGSQEPIPNNMTREAFWFQMVLQYNWSDDQFSLLYCLLRFTPTILVNAYVQEPTMVVSQPHSQTEKKRRFIAPETTNRQY
jgi:hypothetical protein